MYFILSSKQLNELKKLETREDIDNFIDEFWKNLDPNPRMPENELRDEYEKRLTYANQKYKNPYGWGRSDRKRIYILYGPPDFIDYTNWTDINLSTARRFKSIEIWVYNSPARYQNISTIFDDTYPSQMKFIFVDSIGSGVYNLIYNTEEMDYIDPYVIQSTF
jgi:GWxTD domain-containing protein